MSIGKHKEFLDSCSTHYIYVSIKSVKDFRRAESYFHKLVDDPSTVDNTTDTSVLCWLDAYDFICVCMNNNGSIGYTNSEYFKGKPLYRELIIPHIRRK